MNKERLKENNAYLNCLQPGHTAIDCKKENRKKKEKVVIIPHYATLNIAIETASRQKKNKFRKNTNKMVNLFDSAAQVLVY